MQGGYRKIKTVCKNAQQSIWSPQTQVLHLKYLFMLKFSVN